MLSVLQLLAQLPESYIYVHPGKLAAIVVVFVGWALFAQWVDKDTVSVNTYQSAWNLVTILGGAVALALLLLLPIFWAAIGAFAVVNLSVMISYVVHRNGLVVEADKVCTPAHIKRLLSEGFGKKGREKKIEVNERVRVFDSKGQLVKQPEEPLARQTYAHLQNILFDAFLRRAASVEIAPAGQVSNVRVTVDGQASDREALERAQGDGLVAFFKGLSALNLEERRKPQKGKISAQIADTKYQLVVQTNGASAGESLKLRIVGAEARMKAPDLGFTPQQLETIRGLMDTENGFVLVSAPPGHGLSTTIYSFARSHDAFLQNIQLLELEREIEIDNITQATYKPSEEKPFAAELLRMVRTDPDVLLVPELRDRESALSLLQAGAHKQNVYVGIKALDVFDALRRLAELARNPKLLAKSLSAVIHQRLVRKLCETCKAPYKPDPATLKKINLPADKVLYRPPAPEYDKHGNPLLCQNCFGAGYVGRTGVFNLLVIDGALRPLIAQGAALEDIKAAAMKRGGLNLQQHALQKVLDGVTSIDEVIRATRAPGGAARSSGGPSKGGGKRAPSRPAPPGAGGAAPQPAGG